MKLFFDLVKTMKWKDKIISLSIDCHGILLSYEIKELKNNIIIPSNGRIIPLALNLKSK